LPVYYSIHCPIAVFYIHFSPIPAGPLYIKFECIFFL